MSAVCVNLLSIKIVIVIALVDLLKTSKPGPCVCFNNPAVPVMDDCELNNVITDTIAMNIFFVFFMIVLLFYIKTAYLFYYHHSLFKIQIAILSIKKPKKSIEYRLFVV